MSLFFCDIATVKPGGFCGLKILFISGIHELGCYMWLVLAQQEECSA